MTESMWWGRHNHWPKILTAGSGDCTTACPGWIPSRFGLPDDGSAVTIDGIPLFEFTDLGHDHELNEICRSDCAALAWLYAGLQPNDPRRRMISMRASGPRRPEVSNVTQVFNPPPVAEAHTLEMVSTIGGKSSRVVFDGDHWMAIRIAKAYADGLSEQAEGFESEAGKADTGQPRGTDANGVTWA